MWNKKVISWSLYDCANSVFYTTVMAGFFPIFFKKFWSEGTEAIVSTERLGWILGIAGFLLAVLSPLLGIISDRKRSKKKFLFFFMILGVITTAGLYFVPQGDWFSAALLYGIAFFACTASTIFYDSLIMAVTTESEYDRVSSLGYALGYLAGGVVFAFNVVMYLKPEMFGIKEASSAILISFLIVALWWFLLTFPLMKNVDEPELVIPLVQRDESLGHLLKASSQEVVSTFKEIFKNKNLFYFLLAYWFYIDGVSTVMAMAVDFGLALNLEASALIKALLLTQFIGFPSAYLAGEVAKRFGAKYVILAGLVVYAGVIVAATKMTEETHFYIMAGLIGLAQGAVQALSRSMFASLIPEEKSGEYFGFFNLIGKFASVIGPILMAITAHMTGDSKSSLLSLLILFVIGAVYLMRVNPKHKVALE